MLIHFPENKLRHVARFYRSDFGRKSVQLIMAARIQAVEELLADTNLSLDDFYYINEIERIIHTRSMEICQRNKYPFPKMTSTK